MGRTTKHLIAWSTHWAAILALMVAVMAGCSTTNPAQKSTATAGGDVKQDARQQADSTSGGLKQNAERVAGSQTANQFDLSRNQLLLGLAVLAGLAVAIVGGWAWALFLGWFAPQPTDATVSIIARIYLIAYPAGVVVGCGLFLWFIVGMLR